MSTVRTDTLSNVAGTKSVPTSTVVDGSAKAWVNFNGTGTVAIRASFNVSSITDNGTGDYTINFTTPFADANYSFTLSTNVIGGTGYPVPGPSASIPPTTTAFRFATGFQNAGTTTTADPAHVAANFFR